MIAVMRPLRTTPSTREATDPPNMVRLERATEGAVASVMGGSSTRGRVR